MGQPESDLSKKARSKPSLEDLKVPHSTIPCLCSHLRYHMLAIRHNPKKRITERPNLNQQPIPPHRTAKERNPIQPLNPHLVRAIDRGQADLGGILDRSQCLPYARLRCHPFSPPTEPTNGCLASPRLTLFSLPCLDLPCLSFGPYAKLWTLDLQHSLP